ncbi:MAG: hypothetical protein WCK58_15790 [Chloroflexota bacterium]
MRIGRPEWWQRLGGPHAISLTAWLVALPPAVVMTLGLLPEGVSDRAVDWLLLGLAASVVEGLVLMAIRSVAYGRWGRPPTPAGYVLALVLAGLVRGLFLANVAVALGLEHQVWLGTRLLGGVLGEVVRLPIASIIADGAMRHRATMLDLQRAATREQALAVSAAAAIRAYRARLVAETEEQVTAQVRKAAGLVADPPATAARLNELVDEVVRPLSRELEQRSMREDELLDGIDERLMVPAVPIRAYVEGTITAEPFRPLATAFIVAVTPVIAMTMYVGPVAMAETAAACSITVGVILLAARRLVWPRLARLSLRRAAIVVPAIWLAAVAAEMLALGAVPPAPILVPASIPSGWLVIAYLLLAIATIFILAFEASVSSQRVAAERRLGEAVDAAAWTVGRLRQRGWMEHRRLGRLIHGSVQARIVSLALQIELNPPADIPAAISEVASGIHDLLEDERQVSWSEALDQIRAVWDPSITLKVEVRRSASSALASDTVAAQALAAVVGEAITNAVRHGGADEVEVHVGGHRGILDVVITDDGRLACPGQPGLGTRMLDNACLSWSLSTDPAPTTLRARIACDAGGADPGTPR